MQKLTSIEKSKFEEERVRLMLLYLFPEKYRGSVLNESPDIVCRAHDIGIEVTSCRKSGHREKDSLTGQITGKNISQLTEKEKRLIQSGDVFITTMQNGQVLAGYVEWGNENDVPQILQKKLIKLTKVYEKYKTNELFITAWFCDDVELSEISQQIKAINFSKDYCFTRVYLCRDNGEVVEVYEFEKGARIRHLINRNEMNDINNRAKNNVAGERI